MRTTGTPGVRTTGGLRKTAVVITEEQYQEIGALAEERNTSRSQVIRRLIARGLKIERVADAAATAAEGVAQ